ncbi:hypothetical protein QQ045_007997 [Rhodiola kirilowii]
MANGRTLTSKCIEITGIGSLVTQYIESLIITPFPHAANNFWGIAIILLTFVSSELLGNNLIGSKLKDLRHELPMEQIQPYFTTNEAKRSDLGHQFTHPPQSNGRKSDSRIRRNNGVVDPMTNLVEHTYSVLVDYSSLIRFYQCRNLIEVRRFEKWKPVLDSKHGKENVTTAEDSDSGTVGRRKNVSYGKPPRHLSTIRHCISYVQLAASSDLELDNEDAHVQPQAEVNMTFLPILRSGRCSEIGPKRYMEDEHLYIDDILGCLDPSEHFASPGGFYGVFDGHGGTDAAIFIRENILRFIVEDSHFPICIKKAIRNAFLKADCVFAEADPVLLP